MLQWYTTLLGLYPLTTIRNQSTRKKIIIVIVEPEEPDYDDKEDSDKQCEEKPEEATGELNEEQELEQKITINQVF